MTPTKLLSMGLIAIAMLTTSAKAHAGSVAGQYDVRKDNPSAYPAGHRIYSHARIPAPHADQPGGVCDHGDNPMIC